MEFDFRTYNLERYFTPLYTISMPDPKDGGLNMCYMYRTKLSTKEQIIKMHETTVEAVLKGIENPGITLGELIDLAEK